jgi:hypothetical protein
MLVTSKTTLARVSINVPTPRSTHATVPGTQAQARAHQSAVNGPVIDAAPYQGDRR